MHGRYIPDEQYPTYCERVDAELAKSKAWSWIEAAAALGWAALCLAAGLAFAVGVIYFWG